MTTRLRQGDWVASVNALGKGLGDDGRGVISLEPDQILSAACRNTGLDDYGEDDWFVEPLHVLCRALEEEAELTLLGRLLARHEIQLLLQNRLRIEDAIKTHPQILDEEIRDPIFVCGLGRSGTTLLHELLSQDPSHRVPQLWEMRHSVPPPEASSYTTDPRISLADQEIRILDRIDLDFSSMHVNGGDKPNECIFIFGLQFLGDFFVGQYNVPSYAIATASKDLTPVYAYHKKVLQLLQWKNRGARWVLKCPAHLARLNFLFQVYPDARIVVTHRDPLRVMSSMSSLATHLRAMRSETAVGEGAATGALFGERMLLESYMSLRERIPEKTDQIFDLRYQDLMQDPIETVATIYSNWDLPLSEAARQGMRDYREQNPPGRHGKHQYSFEDTGLDLEEERAKFAAYQARFDVPSEL